MMVTGGGRSWHTAQSAPLESNRSDPIQFIAHGQPPSITNLRLGVMTPGTKGPQVTSSAIGLLGPVLPASWVYMGKY